MSNLIDPSYVAASARYHENSPVPRQRWRNTLQHETYGAAPRSDETYNAEPIKSQSSNHFYTQGSDRLHSGGDLNMGQKTAFSGWYSNHGPSHPNLGNSNMRERLDSSGPFPSSEDTSSLISVKMQRQPANIGYEPLPDHGRDPINNDGWENASFGHDPAPEYEDWDSHMATASPADRPYPNTDNNWSLQRLPRSVSKWVLIRSI